MSRKCNLNQHCSIHMDHITYRTSTKRNFFNIKKLKFKKKNDWTEMIFCFLCFYKNKYPEPKPTKPSTGCIKINTALRIKPTKKISKQKTLELSFQFCNDGIINNKEIDVLVVLMQCLETLGQLCTLKKHEYIRISKRMGLYRICKCVWDISKYK